MATRVKTLSRLDVAHRILKLPPDEQALAARYALELFGREGKPGISFKDWAKSANPRYEWYRYGEVLAEHMQAVADGELNRLMVFMPPRLGKSESVTRMGSAYYLYRYPERWVGIVGYGAQLAYGFSRRAREYYRASGAPISKEASAVSEWETGEGGGLWATGIGGPLTGKGGHMIIIDDPVKNEEEANSETIRDKHWDWYDSTLLTRLEPGAALILVMTRWHEDDLAGRIMATAQESGDVWTVLRFDAIHEEPDETDDLPSHCILAEDWRRVGETLCPERVSLAEMKKKRARTSAYVWSSLYQQRPTVREGNVFKAKWFEGKILPEIPPGLVLVRSWDEGSTEDGDPTVGILIGFDPRLNRFVICDQERFFLPPGSRDIKVRQVVEKDARLYGQVYQLGQQEPGSAGKSRAVEFMRLLRGFPTIVRPVVKNKELKAESYSGAWEVGDVFMVRGEWNPGFKYEHLGFPNAEHDDRVDAASEGYNFLSTAGRKKEKKKAHYATYR